VFYSPWASPFGVPWSKRMSTGGDVGSGQTVSQELEHRVAGGAAILRAFSGTYAAVPVNVTLLGPSWRSR